MSRATTTSPPSSARPPRVRPAMRTATSNSSKRSATRRPASRSARPRTISRRRSPARRTNTPTCIRAWRAPRARKVSRKSLTGSRPWPRPRNHMPAVSRRHSTPSGKPMNEGGGVANAPASDHSPDCRRIRKDRMKEGSLEAPTRHVIAWQDPDFTDMAKTEAEMHRVFDICHGCRRCFNLCGSFPRLFDLIDNSSTGELDGVPVGEYQQVADACTLCDMCFMTKCPYVPPHEFNLDFPHLMLRYRAVELKEGRVPWIRKELGKTDRNGELAKFVAPLANWGSDRSNHLSRPLLEKVAGVDRNAALPKYHGRTFVAQAKRSPPPINRSAPAASRKAVLYATCFVNYNNPSIGEAAQAILAKNGVETQVVYPQCCQMPQFEAGDLGKVAAAAKHVAATLGPYIDQGYDIIAMVPSCPLMLKFEWPLAGPNEPAVKKLSAATVADAETNA